MANQFIMTRRLRSEFAHNAHVCYQTGSLAEPAGRTTHNCALPIEVLRRNDAGFSQLYFLSLASPRFIQEYFFDREQAIDNLLRDLQLLQNLYTGAAMETTAEKPANMSRIMDLNTHLNREADFDDFNNAEKINLLIRLQRAVTIIQKQYSSTTRKS